MKTTVHLTSEELADQLVGKLALPDAITVATDLLVRVYGRVDVADALVIGDALIPLRALAARLRSAPTEQAARASADAKLRADGALPADEAPSSGFADPPLDVPAGYRRIVVEAYTDGRRLVVLGDPYAVHDDSEVDAEGWHNCDAMGCGTVAPHVLVNVAVRPEEAPTPGAEPSPAPVAGTQPAALSAADLDAIQRRANAAAKRVAQARRVPAVSHEDPQPVADLCALVAVAREYAAVRAALGAYPDSDVVALATTMRRRVDEADTQHEAATERLRAERERCVAVARGCLDYLGGYHGERLEAFHHGIGTVVTALSADPHDSQTRALERMGRVADLPLAGPADSWQLDGELRQLGPAELRQAVHDARRERDAARAENERMGGLLNTPELHDFAAAVALEAAHQRERWGVDHDGGKTPADWFWLVGYLAGKALHAAVGGNDEKALHHCISTAATLANWHAAISGAHTRMRPGIEPPADEAPDGR